MTTTPAAREARLRRLALQQHLVLRKSRSRNTDAVGHGLYNIADFENVAVAGYGLSGHSMTVDEVEVYLSDAQDFEVHFVDPLGAAGFGERPILEWWDAYPVGSLRSSGWLLREHADSPRDYFYSRATRGDLPDVAVIARAQLADWAKEDQPE
ncbi:hypothetical protein ACFWZW_03445 [Microbacterium enclense]|uniref:hypothetical protein n=1 Tax=Microbacterium enclense TaxID=993073 RepID=UPI0036D970A4